MCVCVCVCVCVRACSASVCACVCVRLCVRLPAPHISCAHAAAAEASAETAVRVSQEELSRFERAIAYICHELRNPLHVIGGFLAQLEAGLSPSEMGLERASLRTAVDIMFTVTNDLLDLAALRQGKLRIAPAATAIRDVLDACASHAGATIVVDSAVPDVVVLDALRVRQIVVNGLTNAVK